VYNSTYIITYIIIYAKACFVYTSGLGKYNREPDAWEYQTRTHNARIKKTCRIDRQLYYYLYRRACYYSRTRTYGPDVSSADLMDGRINSRFPGRIFVRRVVIKSSSTTTNKDWAEVAGHSIAKKRSSLGRRAKR